MQRVGGACSSYLSTGTQEHWEPVLGFEVAKAALQQLLQPGWKTQILPEITKKTLDMGFDSPSTSSPQPKLLYLISAKKVRHEIA